MLKYIYTEAVGEVNCFFCFLGGGIDLFVYSKVFFFIRFCFVVFCIIGIRGRSCLASLQENYKVVVVGKQYQ